MLDHRRWSRIGRLLRRTAAARLDRRVPPRRELVLGASFVGLAVLAFAPVLSDGFVLSLDMVFSPNTDYVAFTFREKGPLYYGRLPLALAMDAAAVVVPHWVIQRLVLFGIVAGSGYAMARATAGWGLPARLFAGTLYAVNPFVYVRVLAGHWYLLLGYAVLPLAVVALHRYLDGRHPGRLGAAVLWTTAAAAIDPHSAVLVAVAGGAVLLAHVVAEPAARREIGRRALRFGAVAAAANAFWLAPAGATVLAGTADVAAFSSADLATFSARGTVLGNVPLSASMLYGFWRAGYRYPFDLLALPVVVGLFAGLLFLVVSGWLDRRGDPLADGLALAALAGVLLGVGVSWPPTEPVATAFFEHTPLGRGMRDSQKFVGLAALGYAFLGGAGVASLDAAHGLSERARQFRDRLTDRGPPDAGPDRREVFAVVAVLLLVGLPLFYTFPMVAGFWGQLETTEYPAEWGVANDRLRTDDDEFRVLVMPWHLYVRFPWAGGTLANPAPMYFDRPMLTSRALEVGHLSAREGDPTRTRVRSLLERRDTIDEFGRAVAPLGAKYVLRLRVADDDRYAFLDRQADLTPVLTADRLVLYRNDAFASAPPPERWPRATPPTPWRALTAGIVVSALTLLGIEWRRRSESHPAA